ncbi:hypothetical protein ACQUET_05305 [Lactococcus lactis]|uniref:hypothetical protein n=1 Tax=Lactococcus lactis TaxID=1358 RepID=UPI003D0EB46A
MSELEKIVDHIVQHEEEQQAEKIKLESEIKDLEEVLEHGISTKYVEEEVIYIYSPKTAHDMREKLYENYKQFHAQLTIPKIIADELDSDFSDIDATDIGYVLEQTSPYGSRAFVNYYFKNKNIISLYLSGKALGVALVKVVEG